MTWSLNKDDRLLHEFIYDVKGDVICFNNNIDDVKDTMELMFGYLKADIAPVQEIIKSIVTQTFTKKGDYDLTMVGSKATGDVYIFICKSQLNRRSSIVCNLSKFQYRPKWLGLLGYQLVLR